MPTLLRKRTKSASVAPSTPLDQSSSSKPLPPYQKDHTDAESTRHLLSANSALPSAAASETSSIYTVRTITTTDADSIRPPADAEEEGEGARTPRASSPQPQEQQQPQPYRGFPSQAHYLAALMAWADEKRYMHATDTTLWGFYGTKTMEEYAAEEPPKLGNIDLGVKRRWRERRERKAKDREEEDGKMGQRRMTVA